MPRPVPMPAGPYQFILGMPETVHLHHLRPALGRMPRHVVQHLGDDVPPAPFRPLLIPWARHEAVLRGRPRNAELQPERRRHGPCAGLHHDLRDVPERLDLRDATLLEAVELVEAAYAQGWPVGGMSSQGRTKVPM